MLIVISITQIKCTRCKGKSEHRERMMDLTVEIHGDIGTLEEALARFTATEVMEGENKYNCGRFWFFAQFHLFRCLCHITARSIRT